MKPKYNIQKRVLIFFVVIAFLTGGLWVWWKDGISAPSPSDTEPVIFVVKRGEGVKSIASRLSQERLVRSVTGFYLLVKILGIEKQIQAGDYRLNPSMGAREVALELTHGILDIWVTTLEGWRSEEIATKIAKELDIPEKEFLKFSREGYMFPDTYLIPRDATAGAVANIFINTFEQKITDQLRNDVKNIGLTFDQVITLASIVEREGRSDSDRPVIAGILLKRFKADWPLQTDATLQFALGYQSNEKTWWKKYLTNEDKKIKSPYNTYLNPGLPPAPIANPGLAAIKAVIYPEQSDYWYYIHDPKGTAHYAETIEEHNDNVRKYLQ